MGLGLYFDVHIPRAILDGLRLRGVDVLTAQADGRGEETDPRLLDRATELRRVLFSFDGDLLVEAARRQAMGIPFAGLVAAHPPGVTIGGCVEDLELIAKACDLDELAGRVVYLSL